MFINSSSNMCRSGVRLISSFPAKFAVFGKSEINNVSPRNVVFITGCDSGLGFNLALLCHSLNMTVISGCRNIESEGAKLLRRVPNSERIVPVEIDITNNETITKTYETITKLLEDNDYEFRALINNAGIMCFGEFEWQTPSLFESQINVNLLGPMRVTHKFLPLIRKYQGRIINVTSHCGLQALTGLSPYTASKAGLRFWTDALRMELAKYHVTVVDFIPGSFVAVSNIAAQQKLYAKEMWDNFDDEQKQHYGDYFHTYHSYLSALSGNNAPVKMQDEKLFRLFQQALLSPKPKPVYKHEPLRYTIYHGLFRISPTPLRDYFIKKFLCMPKYKPKI